MILGVTDCNLEQGIDTGGIRNGLQPCAWVYIYLKPLSANGLSLQTQVSLSHCLNIPIHPQSKLEHPKSPSSTIRISLVTISHCLNTIGHELTATGSSVSHWLGLETTGRAGNDWLVWQPLARLTATGWGWKPLAWLAATGQEANM